MIFLITTIKKYPDELLADFQEYYNIDLTDFIFASNKDGKEKVLWRYGTLCEQLPRGSRVMSATDSRISWGDNTYLLSKIEWNLRSIYYSFMKKAQWPEKDPKPIRPMNDKDREKEIKGEKKMEFAGEELVPVTREKLKEIYGH